MSDVVKTFNIKDLEAGRIHLETHRTGKFAKVREITERFLHGKGEAMKYYDLTKTVQKELGLSTPQEAYNYCRNALKPDKRFKIQKYGKPDEKPITIVVRIAD